MNVAFYDRVLFERLDEQEEKKGVIYGLDDLGIVQIRVIHWGTERDGRIFGEGNPLYAPGAIASIRKEVMGTAVGDGRWLINRAEILGL